MVSIGGILVSTGGVGRDVLEPLRIDTEEGARVAEQGLALCTYVKCSESMNLLMLYF